MTRRALLSAVLAAVLTATLGGVGAQAMPSGPAPTPPPAPALAGRAVSSALAAATGQVTAFVRLDARSGLDVTQAGGSPADVAAATQRVDDLAAAVVPARAGSRSARAAGAPQRLATMANLVAATLVTGDAAAVRALAGAQGVTEIRLVTPKTVDNASSDVFTRALAAWQATGQTGEGITIGVIDTGLDYTHADFGGPGTPAAYAAAYGQDGTGPVPDGLFDPAKFLGGHDFAGPHYDADPASDLPGATTAPTPDDNPIDAPATSGSSGHGTHVAGTAAGYGVQADGSTFRGDHTTLATLAGWPVGPGTAPRAGIYALKVFGDQGGSTNLTAPALDWAADPNGDHDFSDHLDVVNLSLGASGTPVDDPDSLLVDRLAELGTMAVLSAGNSGDATDIAGSPGSSGAGLTVANSVGSPLLLDGVEVTQAPDPAVLGIHPAQNSIAYDGPDVTAPVVFLGDTVDGCTPLTDRAAELTGRIAYLWWDDDDATRACGSAARFATAARAGAVGVLIGTQNAVFAAGISGTPTIPGAQLTAASTAALLPAIRAGGLVAHIGPGLATSAVDTTGADVLNPSSSRGAHGSLGIVKPDVAAPGTSILSAASGTGNQPQALSGTSMASPHVAGIAALVRAAHPGWTPAQAKAAVMNTATHDVFTASGGQGALYGPERVGSGRVDAPAAVADTVLAYDTEHPERVSVTFGVVDVGAEPVTVTRTVTVANTGSTAGHWTTSFAAATHTGDATVTASPAQLDVPAGQSGTVTLTLHADPAGLARRIDPSQQPTQAGGLPREYVASLSGRLVLTAGGASLRVPVQAAPRLVADIAGQPVAFADAGADAAPLHLAGRGVDSGGWTSLAAPLVLAATSPRLTDPPGLLTSASAVASGDLQAVGWASGAPARAAAGGTGGLLGVGIAVHAPWVSLGLSVLPVVDIDRDGDGTPDVQTVVQKYTAETDVTVVASFDYRTGAVLDVQPVNGFFGDVDTTVFDNSVLVAPIDLTAIGVTPGMTPTLHVWTYSSYAPDGRTVDSVNPFTVDPWSPPLWFDTGIDGSFWAVATDGVDLPVHRTGPSVPQVLVLHSHDATPQARAQVVDVQVPAPTATRTTVQAPSVGTAGVPTRVTARVGPAAVTGTVRFLEGAAELATVPVEHGRATAQLTLGAGRHELTAELVPASAAFAGSTSGAVVVHVVRSASSTALTLAPVPGRAGDPVTATVRVTGRSAPPVGSVQVRDGGKVVATGDLVVTDRTGEVTLTLPGMDAGLHTLTATYLGTDDVGPSAALRLYRVVR